MRPIEYLCYWQAPLREGTPENREQALKFMKESQLATTKYMRLSGYVGRGNTKYGFIDHDGQIMCRWERWYDLTEAAIIQDAFAL